MSYKSGDLGSTVSAIALTINGRDFPTWTSGGSGDASLSVIEMNDAQMNETLSFVAPTALWLRAVPSGFSVEDGPLPSRDRSIQPTTLAAPLNQNAYHEIFYLWTITRPAGAASTFQPPGLYGYNMPTVWNNRNVMYGPLVTMCFDVPGEHIVTLWAVDPQGNTATWTKSYNVQDPNVAFAGPLTVCVNPSGDNDYSWAPAGAQTVTQVGTDVQRVQNALSLLNATPSTTTRRLMFKPSATYDLRTSPGAIGTTILNFQPGNGSRRVYVDGNGATVRHGRSRGFQIGRDATTPSVTLANITFQGFWDPDTITSNEAGPSANKPSVFLQGDTHYSLHKVCIRNANECINLGNDNNLGQNALRFYRRLILSECALHDWTMYATYQDPFDSSGEFVWRTVEPNRGRFSWSYLGTKVVMSPLALTGPDKWGPDEHHNGYACFRSEYFEWFHMACTDFFYPGFNQPLIRGPSALPEVETDPRPLRNPYGFHNYDRTVWEGGASPFGNGIDGPRNLGPVPVNAVVDKILAVSHAESFDNAILSISPGTTLRNALVIMPGVARPSHYNNGRNIALRVVDYSTPDGVFANSQVSRVYNTTVAWLPTAAQNNNVAVTFLSIGGLTTVEAENNVFHGPNISQSAGTFATSTLSGFTARYVGLNQAFINIQFNLTNLAPGGTWDVFYTNAARVAAGQPTAPFITAVTFDNRGPTATPSQSYWTSNPTHNYHFIWRTVTNDPLPVPPTTLRGYSGSDTPPDRFFDAGQTSGNRITGAYLSDRIRFTNNTTTTLNGTYRMHIDIRGLHPGPNAAFATPSNLSLVWRPASGNPAVGGATTGRTAYDDLLTATRTGAKDDGAFRFQA